MHKDVFECFYRSFPKFIHFEPDPAYTEATGNCIRHLQSTKRCHENMLNKLSKMYICQYTTLKDKHEYKTSDST